MSENWQQPKERDERWAIVALIVLAAAYVVYRFAFAEGAGIRLEGFAIDLGPVLRRVGKGAGFMGYLAPAAFAIFTFVYKRRRIGSIRRTWEERVRREGLVREESGARSRFATTKEKADSYFTADLLLSRAALYVFDKGLAREPMRLAFHAVEPGEPVVRDVSRTEGLASGSSTIRIGIGGAKELTFSFQTANGERWHADLLRLMGSTSGWID